jgi:ATP-dependent Clp protease ATP-binding subunit ClpA
MRTMERFTERARRALVLAQEYAESLGHTSIGTEHLLIGLMRTDGGMAVRVLHDLGLDERRVDEVTRRMTQPGQQSGIDRLELSSGIKQVLELAVDESLRLGHHRIGTEHLLLGLARQNEGIAIDALKRLSVTPEQIRQHMRRVLQESSAQSQQTPTTNAPTSQVNISSSDISNEDKVAGILTNRRTSNVSWYMILRVAEDEARRHGSHEIGTEFLLESLLKNPRSDIADAVQRHGIDLKEIQKRIEQIPRPDSPVPAKLEFSEHMKTILFMAVDEAFRKRDFFIHPLHMFLALLRQGDNTALTILRNLGIDLKALEKDVRSRFLGAEPSAEKPSDPPIQ